mgnify:CR=1 FL=1
MTQRTFIDTRIATRQDLQPRTWLHHEVNGASYVARINEYGDWAAYQGYPNWSLTKVATSGYRLSEKEARELFPICDHLQYRSLKLIPFKPKRRDSVRTVLNSFEQALERAGIAEIEELKAQRLRAGLALAEAIELAREIKNGSITDLSENVNQLTKRIEEAMYSLRPQGEENTPADYSKEAVS